METKKVTLATIKKFCRDNQNGLYRKVLTHFDGMVDCVMPVDNSEFKKVEDIDFDHMGFVGGSRDYFTTYADDYMVGYEVSNCCGSFILAFQR